MAQICPYCSEEQSALKNHVRLASGDGHGPSGQYPDDFADGADRDDPDPGGGGLEAGLALDEDVDDDRPEPPEPVNDGGGGAVTVEAVENAEPEEVPEYDEDVDEDEEGIVAMPESELNTMLREAAASAGEAAASAGEAVTGGEESEESTDDEDTSIDTPSLDPDDVAEKADENGWGLGAVLALFVLAVVAGVVWGHIKNTAENARERGQQLTTGRDPAIPGV